MSNEAPQPTTWPPDHEVSAADNSPHPRHHVGRSGETLQPSESSGRRLRQGMPGHGSARKMFCRAAQNATPLRVPRKCPLSAS